MIRQLPIVVGVAAIVALTVVQSLMSDRFISTNVTAEQRAALLKQVPMSFGEWEGKNLEVTEEVRDTAGAVGCVSRLYQNTRTGAVARLWLIVGHARDISAHTPDICYKGSGFAMRSDRSSQFSFNDKANFFTNTFIKEDVSGRNLERVFWAWYNPKPDQSVEWEVHDNPRYYYGNVRALFKMYFASQMRDLNETTDESTAAKFGKDFLPVINNILLKSDIGADEEAADATFAAPAGTPASSAPASETTAAKLPAADAPAK